MSVRSKLFSILMVVCVCTLLMYKMEQTALNSLDEANNHWRRPLPVVADSRHEIDVDLEEADDDRRENHEAALPKVWIAMGLCWSENTKQHGKANFPYSQAVFFSSQLWLKLTRAKVILQIVYTEPRVTPELEAYSKNLTSQGVLVKLVQAGHMKCVLKSQLIRLLAFDLEEVSDDDILITADVDAFVASSDILIPLKIFKDRQIWIYRYQLSQSTGYTFMLVFIGARAETWRSILLTNPSSKATPEHLIQIYSNVFNQTSDSWDIDQHIVSHAILKSGLCSLPRNNTLWAEVHLEPNDFDDSSTCWHGSGVFEDCNKKLWWRNAMIRYHGKKCRWWHFYPEQTVDDMRMKFEEIMSGNAESGIVNNVMASLKGFQKKWLGTSLI